MRRYIGLAFWVGFAVMVGSAMWGVTLHAAWVSQDIGSPGQAGSMTGTPPGPITIYGGGGDIWGNADQFHFAYNDQPVDDFSAIVRVVSQQNTDGWAKAGIMARADLTPGSIHINTSATPSNGVSQQWRDSTGGGSGSQGLPGSPGSSAAPYWIRMDRVGTTFDSYWAPDLGGTPGTWQGMQSHTSSNMPATAYLGLSVTSHNNGVLSQVVFDGMAGFQLFDATRNSAATGYWDVAATWTPSGTPGANDYLIVGGVDTVTSRLAVDVGGRLDIVDNGMVMVQPGAVLGIGGDVSLSGSMPMLRVAGRVSAANVNVGSSAMLHVLDGGTLEIAGELAGNSTNPIVLQDNATLEVGSGLAAVVTTQGNSNVTVNGGLLDVGRLDAGSVPGTLTKRGTGTLSLDNFDGTGVVGAENLTVDVHEGTLYARGAQPLGGTSPTTGVAAEVVLSGGTLSVEGGPAVLSNQLNYGFYANAAADNLPNIDDGIDNNGANGGLFSLTPSPQSQWPSQVRGKAVWTDEVWQGGNIGDNYCQMWWGHVNVPDGMTGDFTVYVHGDDYEVFWLDVGQDGEFNTGIDDITRNVDGEEDWNTPHTETVTLTGGQTYDFAIAHREGGGGDFVNVEITPPTWTGIPAFRINPSDPDQDGLWSRSAPGAIDMTGTPITVTADSGLNAISEMPPAAFGNLTLNDGTTLTTTGADMTFAGASVAGGAGRTGTLAAENNVILRGYTDGSDAGPGTATTFVKSGPGTLVLDNTGGNLHAANTTFEVAAGRLEAGSGAQHALGGATRLTLSGGTASFGDVGGTPPAVSDVDVQVSNPAVSSTLDSTSASSVGFAGLILADGTTLRTTGGAMSFSNMGIAGSAGRRATLNTSNNIFAANYTDSGTATTLVKTGTGTLTLEPGGTINAAATTFEVNQGTLALTDSAGLSGPAQVVLDGTTLRVAGEATTLAGMRGSVFFGVPRNESHLDLVGGAYEHNSGRVLTGDKAGTILIDGREDFRHNTLVTGTIQNWNTFPTFDGNADDFVTAFSGVYTPRVSGEYTFRWSNDDRGLMFIDLDGDGVFQSSDQVGNYTGSHTATVNLIAGQPYTVIKMAQEHGGGQSVNWWLTEPGGSEARVNPTDGRGTWETPGAGPIDLQTTLVVDNGPADALMGSIFFGVPRDESHLNLDGASYQHNLTRVITGDKADTILVDGREHAPHNTVISGTTQNWDSFSTFNGSADDFVTAFSGTFTPRVSGTHNFHWNNDDRGLMYLDLDGDGVFQNSERVAGYGWNSNGNVNLTAGESYGVIYMAQEYAGGQSVHWFFTEPGGSEVRVNPGDPSQVGLWGSPGLLATSTLHLVSDSTANLQALVLKNGNLRITGGNQLSIGQASIDPGTTGAVGLVVETPTLLTGAGGVNGNNAAVTITKSGPATLTIDRSGTGLQNADFRVTEGTLLAKFDEPFGPDGTTVTLAGGTFELEGSPVYTPGLLAGSHSGNTWTGGPNPGNLGISLGPEGLIRAGAQGDIREAHWRAARADGGTGPDNTTLIYTGEVYLDGTTTFVEQNDDRTMLWVGGQQLINDGAWGTAVAAAYTPTDGAGWYDFEVRFSNGGGGYGFSGQGGGNWGAVDFGFGMAPGAVSGTNPLDYAYPEDPGDASLFRIVETGPIDAPEVNIGVDGGGTLRLTTATSAALGNLTFQGGTLNVTGAPDGVTFTGGGVHPDTTAYTLNNPMDITVDGPFDGGGATANFTKTGTGQLTLAQGTTNHGGVSTNVQRGRLVAGGPMQAANLLIGGAADVDTGEHNVTIGDGGVFAGGTLTVAAAGASFAVGGDNLSAGQPARLELHGGTVSVQNSGMPNGLAFHVDAADAATLWQDTGGANSVTADGQAVARWDDKSISGIVVSQGNAGNRPVYQASVASLNGQPALYFDSDALTSTSGNSTGITGDQDLTVITVWADAEGTGTNYQHTFHMGNPTTREAYGHSVSRGGNAGEISNHYYSDGWNSSSTDGLGTPNIALSTYDSIAHQDTWWVNGDPVGSRDVTVNLGSSQLQVGSRLNPVAEGIRGNVAEILVFEKVLTPDEMNNIGGYLAAKYGISAPAWTGNIDPQPLYLPDTDVTVTANATLLADSPSTATFGNLALTGAGVNLTLDGAPGGFTFRNVAGGNSIAFDGPGDMLTVTGVLDPGGDPTDPAAGVHADFILGGDLTLDSGAAYRWEAGLAATGDWPDSVHVEGDLTLSDWTLAVVDPGRDGLIWEPLPLFLGFDSVTWDPDLVSFDFTEAPEWLVAANPDLMSVRHLLDGPRGEGLYLLVPEPSSLLLLVLGVLALLLRRKPF